MNEVNEPLRLLRRRGSWTLEVTKLVAVDQHVLRPERRRVNGTDSVVRHLKERCPPSLVREALDLLVGEDDGTDRAFALEGEHWIQLHDDSASEANGASPGHLLALIGELRGELTTLRALHEAMRGRVAVLERRSLQMPVADQPRAQLRGATRREHGGVSLRPLARGRSLAPPEEAQAAGVPSVPMTQPTAQSPTPTKPALTMPSHADLATCLKQLLGTNAELRPERGNVPHDLEAFYLSRIMDSADQEVGGILLDLRCGVELGGRLLGFPPSSIEEQSKSDPSGDVLDAMNEVINNLGGFVNRANPLLRVRVRPLEKLTGAEPAWLPQNTGRIGCTTKTGGRLWLATR